MMNAQETVWVRLQNIVKDADWNGILWVLGGIALLVVAYLTVDNTGRALVLLIGYVFLGSVHYSIPKEKKPNDIKTLLHDFIDYTDTFRLIIYAIAVYILHSDPLVLILYVLIALLLPQRPEETEENIMNPF